VGPNGINLLKDLTGDGQVTIDDIVIEQRNPGLGFQILLGSELAQLQLPIDFDLGIPGLKLDIDANVTGALGFEFGLKMGVDLDRGFFIDTNSTALQVFVDVAVPGLSASGELGFLRVDAKEILASAEALVSRGADINSQLTIASIATGSPASFDVRFIQNGSLTAGQESGTFDAAHRILHLTINSTVTTAQRLVDLITNDVQLRKHLTASLVTGGNGTGLVSANQRPVGVANSFAGRFVVQFLDPGADDGLLTLDEMLRVRSFKDVVSIDATAIADLNLSLSAMLGESASFPSIYANLGIDWDYQLGASLQLPTVSLTDIELGLGEFLTGFAGGVFEKVESVIEPVRPIINFLSEPLPVVSDLAGSDITLLDFMRMQGGQMRQVVAFIDAVKLLDGIIQSIPDPGSSRLPIGNATFDPNTGEFTIAGGAAQAFTEMAGSFTSKAPASGGFNPNNFLHSEEELEEMGDDKLKLGFPILNPTNVLKLLGGQVTDLFTLELPTLTLEAKFKKLFPLPPLPVVGIELAGTFTATADFAFGFDTFGIEQFKQTGNYANIINGFYVFDHETADGGGDDINELVLTASITAAAALDAGILKAAVGGGIFANVDFNLHDNNDDGKIRLVELLDNTLLGTKDGLGPIHIFDVSGRFDAGLFADVTVDLGLIDIDKHFDLASVTLFEFDFPRPDGEGVQLAQFSNGALSDGGGSTLELNIGPNAGRRNFIYTTDVDEDYKIYAGDQPGKVIIEAFGRSQVYTGVSRIVGNAGIGDDSIFISEDVKIPIEVSGGDGNDTIIGGAGNDILRGGPGHDDLRGGAGNDQLFGGEGRDQLLGEAGDDSLSGGADDDTLNGGDDNDVLRGDDGNDTALGGSGDDVIFGGLGFDILAGEGGDDQLNGDEDSDQIEGGDGSDLINGGAGNDLLRGNDGNDEIHGGPGNDNVFGGVGNDRLFGDDGDDHLLGENSRDTIYGGAGNDILEGGLAADELYGGLDDDLLFYNVSDLTQIDEAGHVLVGGGGHDVIRASPLAFDNTIFGDGVNDETGAVDPSTDGSDEIHGGAGRDHVDAGGLHDVVYVGDGDDFVDAGAGDDTVFAGAGSDFVIGGFGDDHLFGETGDDVIWGGLATETNLGLFDRSVPANFVLPPRFAATEALYPTGYSPAINVTPAFTLGLSIDGVQGDGRDLIDGSAGNDILFGGADADIILGGDDADYIDAGAGNDIHVDGGAGDDVVRGGGNSDILHGGSGIDQILGDGGDDRLFGDEGTAGSQLGQRLFGGDGGDVLSAYAPTTVINTEAGLRGDQLFGDADGDTLNGNLRQELLVGGAGDDLLRGDYLAGSAYAVNATADQTGADDELRGEGGEDQLFGGGGNDMMWGGPDTDYFDGQKGDDTQYGGGGNDLFVISAVNPLHSGTDVIDGHFGNAMQNDSVDDSTDTVIINGTLSNDVIGLSQTKPTVGQPQLRIDYREGALANRVILVNWLDVAGNPLIEQFQIAGLGGNDTIGFAGVHPSLLPLVDAVNSQPLDVSRLVTRSSDWIATLDGNSGHDILIGGVGRDRMDGGSGSDQLFGFAGDDRLLGGHGAGTDHDILYAGQGNDDLIGGDGTNELYAWTLNPKASEFGVFVDASGNLFDDSAGGTRRRENTGLNRILGGVRDDELYGGTVIDFMHGREGNNTLYRNDGSTFESLGAGISGTEWIDYARETGQVWYVSGTNARDEIDVNYVTAPGVLADHHLVTILTDNNDNFSFDAQVRLDFSAVDGNGDAIWNPSDLVTSFSALLAAKTDEERATLLKNGVTVETNLINNLLPPEGDFLAIIIDAKDGNDQITIGPTVRKSVWIAAGAGDDVVTIRGGNSILPDKAESAHFDGLRVRNDAASHAFELSLPGTGVQFDHLTLDSRSDQDWFQVTLPSVAGSLNVTTASSVDEVTLKVFGLNRLTDANAMPLATISGLQSVSITDLNAADLSINTPYLLQVQTNETPTIYGIEFDFGGTPARVDLGLRSDLVRRDIILGGDGNDILMGGPGEDWILGGNGDDVISGGLDRLASDILLGEGGNDTFQIIPDELPVVGNQQTSVFDPHSGTYRPTANDEIDGGDGLDRMLYVGGNLDRTGLDVPDFAALRYNTGLHRYEFSSLVWDIGQQQFAEDPSSPDQYLRQYLFFQTHNVEQTQIELQNGNDSFHADPGYLFPGSVGPEEWGIKLGNFEQGATAGGLLINGGNGTDQLFGGALDDIINGGPGNDTIVGSQGNDSLYGDAGNDTIFGLKDTTATPLTPRLPVALSGTARGFSEFYSYDLVAPFFARPVTARSGVDLNATVVGDLTNDASGFSGTDEESHLSSLRLIGDFNGDGLKDFMISGETRSYLLPGPVDPDGLDRVDLAAAIIVDHATFGRPAVSFGDVNNDGFADLAFLRADGSDHVITVVFGGTTMLVNGTPTEWVRDWNSAFVNTVVNVAGDSSFRTIRLRNSLLSPSAEINLHLLDITGDHFADIVAVADSTTGGSSIVKGMIDVGFAFSGNVAANFTRTTEELDLTYRNLLAVLRADGATTDLKSVAAGDLNGDGITELLFGQTNLTVRAEPVTSARVVADRAPRASTHAEFESPAPLGITLGNQSVLLSIATAKGDALTDLVTKINAALRTSPLADRVIASENAGKIELASTEGGSGIGLSVAESLMFGFLTDSLDINSFQNLTDVPIPSVMNGETHTSSISVTADKNRIIQDIRIGINLNHTYDDDLIISLTHPGGTTIELAHYVGGSGNNFTNTYFTESATKSINEGTAPFSGSFRPHQPLSVLRGLESQGTWTLTVYDLEAGDSGTLLDWSLTIDSADPDYGDILAGGSLSSSLLPSIPEGQQTQVVLHRNSDSHAVTPTAAGDVNEDGYADFAFSTDSDVRIYYGGPDASSYATQIQQVADINPGPESSIGINGFGAGFATFGDELIFAAESDQTAIDPFIFGGGVRPLGDFKQYGNSYPNGFTEFLGDLYFTIDVGDGDLELMRYDGSTVVTVANIVSFDNSSPTPDFTVFLGQLYFAGFQWASGGAHPGTELYRFDGSTVQLVSDIHAGTENSDPSHLTTYNGALYFAATDGTNGTELWKYSGTGAPIRISQINAGSLDAAPADLTVFDGQLYFTADNGSGRTLWSYDGSTVTQAPGRNGSTDPEGLFVHDNRLWFSATEAGTGRELWNFDGTSHQLIADIYPGATGSGPESFAVLNGELYFSANDGVHGAELMRWNGTAVEL
ncbi:MAG: proprotein convertase P-domain-containing protein, partial [Planctomycetaceae bacterium]|nr:proprotein convertase P-domain-containing protein [Planctomycetaceae bacterium]